MRRIILFGAGISLIITGCTAAPETDTSAPLPPPTVSSDTSEPANTAEPTPQETTAPAPTEPELDETSTPTDETSEEPSVNVEPIAPVITDGASSTVDMSDELAEAETPTPAVSATIANYVDRMYMTDSTATLFLSTDPVIVNVSTLNSECSDAITEPGSGLLGCYTSYPSRIFLLDLTDGRVTDAEPVVAAHEMLHAVWYQVLTSTERATLTAQMTDYFDSLPTKHYLRQRLQGYINSDPSSLPTELHSILGSEAKTLPAELETYYSRFFTNRQKVVSLADKTFGYIYRLSVELEEEFARLGDMSSEISSTRPVVNAANEELSRVIAEFNDAVNSGAYSTQAEYDAARADVEAFRMQVNRDLDAFNALIEEYNTAVAEYNVGVAESRSLAASLNIAQN